MAIITGIFRNKDNAESAIAILENRGFRASEIGLILSDIARQQLFAEERGSNVAKGAGGGAALGGTLGAIIAGLTAVGSIAVPGMSLFAAGPIIAMLTGAGAGAATGTIAGALVGVGISEDEATHYEGELRDGRAMVTVHTDDEAKADIAREILRPYKTFPRVAA